MPAHRRSLTTRLLLHGTLPRLQHHVWRPRTFTKPAPCHIPQIDLLTTATLYRLCYSWTHLLTGHKPVPAAWASIWFIASPRCLQLTCRRTTHPAITVSHLWWARSWARVNWASRGYHRAHWRTSGRLDLGPRLDIGVPSRRYDNHRDWVRLWSWVG